MAKVTQRDVCRSYLDQKRYEKMPTTTLAKLIYSQNTALFKSAESARSALRFLRGTNGKQHRDNKHLKKDVRKYAKNNPGKVAPIPAMPKAKKHFKEWSHFEIKADKMLVLSDVHIPYHDDVALDVALSKGEEVLGPDDAILLNGDFTDHYACSFWEKDPRKRDFSAELDIALEALEHLRARFPTQRIVWKEGNHENRYSRYMTLKAPELLGVDAFKHENLYDLESYGIEWVNGKRPITFQDYTILHGHEFYGSGGVFPAKGYFQKTKVNTISAHLHRSSFYSEKDVNGKVSRSYSSGCLCDLTPDYSPLNAWDHSFLIMTKGKNGAKVKNYVIEDGEIV